MNKKILILVLLIPLSLILFFSFSIKKLNLEKQHQEELILLNNTSFNDKKINLIQKTLIKDSDLPIHQIFLEDNNKKIILEELLPAGYHSTNINTLFIFYSEKTQKDYLIISTFWDSENMALDISGIFYDILIFDEYLNRLNSVEEAFFDFDSEDDKEYTNNIRSNKDLIIQKLKELESQGLL